MELLPGDFISDCIALTGTYEPVLTRRLLQLAHQSGTLVDVGANLGYFSLLWAASDSRNKCLAFEASPRNIEILRRNVKRNQLEQQIRIIPKAAGAENGKLMFEPGPEDQTGWGGLTLTKVDGCIEVDVTRVDEVVGSESPIALKVDTEGADLWALMGCERFLRTGAVSEIFYEQNKPRMAALGIPPDGPLDYLRSLGYVSTPHNDTNAQLVQWSAIRPKTSA